MRSNYHFGSRLFVEYDITAPRGFEERLLTYSIRCFSMAIFLTLHCAPQWAFAETVTSQGLFHIERNKNANIVQYDAQVGMDGKLVNKKPVVAYWIRHAEQGQVKKLSWIQRTFAFGFKARPIDNGEHIELIMKIDFGEPITIIHEGKQYRATIPIDGSPSYLEKVFVQASGRGLFTKVQFIELFGIDMETGAAHQQRLYP